MDPIFLVPIALAVAWAASRKKKSTPKTTTPTPTEPDPIDLPGVHDDPFVGPGGEEPWRPGGPDLPPYDGPVGPKQFPGPSGGPKPPEAEDPSPVEVFPGTTIEEIEEHEHAGHGLFISSDCETVYVGDRWFENVFLPQARLLVHGMPDAFHHPVAVIYELLVAPSRDDDGEPTTPAAACVAAWGEFVYGGYTPEGTYSGWIVDDTGEYWEYLEWFDEEYPELNAALESIYRALWDEPDLAEVFDRDWPLDAPSDDGGIDFEPTGT